MSRELLRCRGFQFLTGAFLMTREQCLRSLNAMKKYSRNRDVQPDYLDKLDDESLDFLCQFECLCNGFRSNLEVSPETKKALSSARYKADEAVRLQALCVPYPKEII